MKNREYGDWFGEGDTNIDVEDAIKLNGKPDKVFYESGGFMAALVYQDRVVCVGYDGNEYCHSFTMSEEEQANEQ